MDNEECRMGGGFPFLGTPQNNTVCCLYLFRYMNAQEKVCKEAPQTADSVILGEVLGAGGYPKAP